MLLEWSSPTDNCPARHAIPDAVSAAATKRLAMLFAASVVLVIAIGLVVWRGASNSLEAEATLHAYNLVLDVVTQYIKENGKWPDNWDALAKISPALEHSIWTWPRDVDEIRKRVKVDFSLQIRDVASMHEDTFNAIEQMGPHYGGNESEIRELIATAKRVSH